MIEETLKLTSVLSDETRLSIYKYVLSERKEVTVQEIAEQFSIHPNVARMHLARLVDVNMLVAHTKRSVKGGRPRRIYQLSDEVVQLQYPYRDYKGFAQIALQSLSSLGIDGIESFNQIGFNRGVEIAKLYIHKHYLTVSDLTIEEKVKAIRDIAKEQGLDPILTYDKEEELIDFHINNCTFQELVDQHSSIICSMHQELFKGIFSSFFGEYTFNHTKKEKHSCEFVCSYTISSS